MFCQDGTSYCCILFLIDAVACVSMATLGSPAAIINEYKARMLNSPRSQKVIEAIYSAALDDEHKHQSAAWKLIIDRILPVAAFEKDIIKNGGQSAIQINISGVSDVSTEKVVNDEDVIDG